MTQNVTISYSQTTAYNTNPPTAAPLTAIKSNNIYRQAGAAAPVLLANVPVTAEAQTYLDPNVPPGPYNYIVSDVDQNGVEGVLSNGFPYVVPQPPAQLGAPTIVNITGA